jgi:hypothetical protein
MVFIKKLKCGITDSDISGYPLSLTIDNEFYNTCTSHEQFPVFEMLLTNSTHP